ncbi:MAG: hypothetical protein Q8M05_03830 [Rhodoferax sp.]|uniref:hypothetical protein n=1 Tax=Rhodoferax sp. TaxID=50421 RepID=UPI00272F14C1|nr:hypothetical protein [Rhodoferax sp.]MDP1528492.1 hypothetical protein [Rhodoferax sp.]
MLALVLAAALFTTPVPPGDMTRSVLSDVCLPYVTGEASDTVALEFLGFVATSAGDSGNRSFQTEDQAYLLRLTTEGSVADGNLNRVCVIQARRSELTAARASVAPVLRQQGFTAETGLPADRSIWTKGGLTVSVRQSPGTAAIVRVTFSSLDAGL